MSKTKFSLFIIDLPHVTNVWVRAGTKGWQVRYSLQFKGVQNLNNQGNIFKYYFLKIKISARIFMKSQILTF